MILSNDGFVAFHYRSYGTFFLHKIGSIISIGDLPTTNIIEPLFLFARICNRRIIIKIQEKACLNVRKFEHECFFCVIIFCE